MLEKGDMRKFEEGQKIMEMIEFINDDKFWKAQIAQMDINWKGRDHNLSPGNRPAGGVRNRLRTMNSSSGS